MALENTLEMRRPWPHSVFTHEGSKKRAKEESTDTQNQRIAELEA